MHAMHCIIKSYSHCKCGEGQAKELLMGAVYKVCGTAACLARKGEVSTVQVHWWSCVEWPTVSSTGTSPSAACRKVVKVTPRSRTRPAAGRAVAAREWVGGDGLMTPMGSDWYFPSCHLGSVCHVPGWSR